MSIDIAYQTKLFFLAVNTDTKGGTIKKPIRNPLVAPLPELNPENTGSPIAPIRRYIKRAAVLFLNPSREEMTNTAIVCREKFITNGTVIQDATTVTATPKDTVANVLTYKLSFDFFKYITFNIYLSISISLPVCFFYKLFVNF